MMFLTLQVAIVYRLAASFEQFQDRTGQLNFPATAIAKSGVQIRHQSLPIPIESAGPLCKIRLHNLSIISTLIQALFGASHRAFGGGWLLPLWSGLPGLGASDLAGMP